MGSSSLDLISIKSNLLRNTGENSQSLFCHVASSLASVVLRSSFGAGGVCGLCNLGVSLRSSGTPGNPSFKFYDGQPNGIFTWFRRLLLI